MLVESRQCVALQQKLCCNELRHPDEQIGSDLKRFDSVLQCRNESATMLENLFLKIGSSSELSVVLCDCYQSGESHHA